MSAHPPYTSFEISKLLTYEYVSVVPTLMPLQLIIDVFVFQVLSALFMAMLDLAAMSALQSEIRVAVLEVDTAVIAVMPVHTSGTAEFCINSNKQYNAHMLSSKECCGKTGVFIREKLTIVVAYRDRLARFGTELISLLIEQNEDRKVEGCPDWRALQHEVQVS